MTRRERVGLSLGVLLWVVAGKTSLLYYWLVSLIWSAEQQPWVEPVIQRFAFIGGPFLIGFISGRRGWLYGGVIPTFFFLMGYFAFQPYIGSYGRNPSVKLLLIFVFAMLLPLTAILGLVGELLSRLIAPNK